MILVSHPVGNQNVRALLSILNNADLLHSFHTSLALHNTSFWCQCPGIGKEFGRRAFDDIEYSKLHSYPFLDISRLISNKLKLFALTKRNTGIFCPENVYDYIDAQSAKYLVSAKIKPTQIYGYDGKCRDLFKTAKSLGNIKLTYEAAFGSIAYAHEILKHESDNNPEWIHSIPKLSQRTIQKQNEELELADQIIVASKFAQRTLKPSSSANKKTLVIPYGSQTIKPRKELSNTKKGCLKVMYVGALTQQKGISYLFEALNIASKNVELKTIIIGDDYANGSNRLLNIELRKYTWLSSAPHQTVINHLLEADILILPSLAEAFGLVVAEALSTGTTVIVSENCGAADLITNGVNGYIVPIRSAQSIADILIDLSGNPEKLNFLKNNALQTSYGNTWEAYAKGLIDAIDY